MTFKLGAKVIIEGPAHFRLTSIDSLQMLNGNVTVRADTEEARGFVVKSPVAKMTDLGTAFGAAVDREKQTDLHVFQGLVEVCRTGEDGGQPMRLSAGQRIVIRSTGGVEVPSLGADSRRFARDLASTESDYRRWRRSSESIRQSPDIVGCYAFEASSDDDRLLSNAADSGSASARRHPRARWCDGRWPGKRALRFSERGDHVRLNVPGEYRALSLAAWVNVEGLENEFNGLLLSDGWANRAGQCHWQLTRSGRMDFGVSLSETRDSVYRSPLLPELDDPGRWLHLAVVYDTAARQNAFYADGRQVNVKPLTVDVPLAPGDCEIGNWDSSKHNEGFPMRNFQGRIDELLIFRRARARRK